MEDRAVRISIVRVKIPPFFLEMDLPYGSPEIYGRRCDKDTGFFFLFVCLWVFGGVFKYYDPSE
jgi:hypothetical protein